MTLLRTDGVTRQFGGITAVDGVDFELRADECCSLIGPNGAGKTTFFDLLTGTLAPTDGGIWYRSTVTGGESEAASGAAESTAGGGPTREETDGAESAGSAPAVDRYPSDDRRAGGGWEEITDASPDETARMGIHRSYQITNVFPTSTALENVRVAAQAHGGADSWKLWRNEGAFEAYREEAWSILERVGLAERADVPAESLSHGQKRNLEVAIALAGDPDVLLLDEPTAGVSRDGIPRIVSLIDDVAGDHAVLLVEHNMDVVMDVSDRIAVLHQGQLIADDEPEAVRADPDVQRAYLGGYEADGDGGGTAAGARSGERGTGNDDGDRNNKGTGNDNGGGNDDGGRNDNGGGNDGDGRNADGDGVSSA